MQLCKNVGTHLKKVDKMTNELSSYPLMGSDTLNLFEISAGLFWDATPTRNYLKARFVLTDQIWPIAEGDRSWEAFEVVQFTNLVFTIIL